MTRPLIAGFAMAALAGCGKGTPQTAADSARSVELARADSLYRLGDKPAAAPAPSPAPKRADKAGATFTAAVSSDVKDSKGRVVIPAGSTVNRTITELQPANDKSKADGKITVDVSSVTVGGQTYGVSAGITDMVHTLKGRGVGTTEVGKTDAGAVIGLTPPIPLTGSDDRLMMKGLRRSA